MKLHCSWLLFVVVDAFGSLALVGCQHGLDGSVARRIPGFCASGGRSCWSLGFAEFLMACCGWFVPRPRWLLSRDWLEEILWHGAPPLATEIFSWRVRPTSPDVTRSEKTLRTWNLSRSKVISFGQKTDGLAHQKCLGPKSYPVWYYLGN